MGGLIEYLKDFNSKERFFLVGQILGKTDFIPSDKFRQKLGESLGLKIPDEMFSSMDYHIDWIYASLELAAHGDKTRIHLNSDGTDSIIKAQQEDVDFLIAYNHMGQSHLIFIEAKGVTGYTKKQMDSKMKRLEQIFGNNGKRWPNVTPHFVLMSPKEPKRLNIERWPVWARRDNKVAWLELLIPENLKSIARCDEQGQKNKDGRHWKVASRKSKRD